MPSPWLQILIADDHERFRTNLKDLLESHPNWHVCAEAADGREAVDKAKQLKPDVALLDVSMPEMNGLDAARVMIREKSAGEILIISQNDPAIMEEAALRAGARGFISKSRVAEDLIRTIERIKGNGAETGVEPGLAESARVLSPLATGTASSLLAAIVDSSDDAIASKNLDGFITSWNHSAERIFGYSAEEAIGRHISLIIPSDRLQEETEILNRLRRGERVDHFETVRKTKDGRLLNVSLTISPVRDAHGRVIGASKVARDITDRIRAQERERRITADAIAATAKFRAVFEQTAHFAGIMSKEGLLLEVNRFWLDACGYRADQIVGRPIWETPWWRNFPETREKIRVATPLAVKGTIYREILHYSRADGAERLVDFGIYPITDGQGEVLFLHPTGVDITDIKLVEENYRRLVERLDAEVRARTHELEERNADVIRQSQQLRELSWQLLRAQDEERRHIARELHDSAGQLLTVLGIHLNGLIEAARRKSPDLLPVAEQSGDLVQQLTREIRTTSYLLHPPLLDEVGLSGALSWYIDGLKERSPVRIEFAIREDFGRLPRELELLVFRFVQECLTNIHRHSGSTTAAIHVTREANRISVEVRDSGKGIPPEKLAEIQSKGSGVGIRGIRERLRQFHGEMTIHSDSTGTRMFVTIPVSKEFSEIAQSRS